MAETLIWRIINDILTVGIVGGFILFVISKFRKTTIQETWEDIKNFLSMREKEE